MRNALLALIGDFRYRKISQSATVNDLLKEFFRKSIHFCAALVPWFAERHFDATVILLSVVLGVYGWSEYRRLGGCAVPVISRITVLAARKRDEGRFVLGPVTMAVGVLFTLLLFPGDAAKIGIYALAFGDGIASLAGKLWGKTRLPLTRGKSLEGSLACFLMVFISSLTVLRNPLAAFAVAAAASLVELIPLQDYDNLFIPIAIAGFVSLLP